jgi:hypothetical protein
MELEYLRKIHQNKTGYYELAVPPQVVKALGTQEIILRVKDKHFEVIPRPKGSKNVIT